jgi:DNA-binding NarL/FixJ family response regulator
MSIRNEGAELPWTGDGPCVRSVSHVPPIGRDTMPRPYPIGYARRPLTARQKEVARMLGEDKKQTEIAYQLRVSTECVQQEIRATCDKLLLYNTQSLRNWARMYPELLLT